MNSLEIKERKAILTEKAKAIIAKCRSEVREMTEEEQAEFDAAKAEIETLKQQLAELEAKLKLYEVEDDTMNDEPMEMAGCTDKDKNKRNINFSTKMKTNKRFSLINAINDVVNNRSFNADTQTVIDAARKEMRGVSYSGQIQIPFNRAAITVASEGEDTVGIDLWDIERALRAKSILSATNCRFITGLTGDIQIPVMSGGSNCYWESEQAPAKDGNVNFSSVKLSPKRISAVIEVSKQFLAQSSESVENILREDLINAINQKLESTILGDGEGSATQPAGMFYGKNITEQTDTFAKLVNLEAQVEDANVNNPICYVASNKAKAAFRSMAKSSKNTQLVLEGGEVDGTPLYATSNCLQNGFIVGDFSNLCIAFWSNGIDILIDPFSLADKATVRIIANLYVDAKVIRPEAFAYGKTTV